MKSEGKIKEEAKEALDKKPEALLKQQEEEPDELIGKLIGEDGKIKVDTTLPKELEIEVMANMLVDHLISFRQTKEAWRSARNSSDHARSQQLFQQMQYNQLTAAIIQAEYPEAKAIAEEIAISRAYQAKRERNILKTQMENAKKDTE